MPNRILRDWTDSEALSSVSAHAERLFTRVLMKMDDYGCYVGNPSLLRANLFPLLVDRIREADISLWIAECEKAGMVRSYVSGGKQFIFVPKHGQRPRDSVRKHPAPPPEIDESPQIAASCGETRPKTKTYSETNSETRDEDDAGEPPGVLGCDSFKAAWKEYTEYRRLSKFKKLLPASVGKLWRKMEPWGTTEAIDAINTTISNGWQGIFQPKPNGQGGKNGRASAADRGEYESDLPVRTRKL